MRTKLMCDIHNRLGMPSFSANYITMYLNNKYMGLYIMTDTFKESLIKYVYGEKDTKQLYMSESGSLSFGDRKGFENENKDITDYSELYKFLASLTKAKSSSDNHQNNKWIYLIHDFDFDMGVKLGGIEYDKKNITEYNMMDIGFTNFVNKFILNDDRKYNETLKEIVTTVFNPATLLPRIDELKSYIEPYVKLDKTPNENGEYP
eukprot:jgi/Orpsp1_1/1175734/evm.model.c7180000055010.1